MNAPWRRWETAPRFSPLVGVAIGAVGGAVYWLGAQLWPTSIAVLLSMFATALLAAGARSAAAADSGTGVGMGMGMGTAGIVFTVLIKYDALMALSAANLALALPANLALGLIMIAGHAGSRALVVSVLATPAGAGSRPASLGDLGIALGLGFAPAALLGMPGLVGLAAAIVARIVFVAYLRRKDRRLDTAALDTLRQVTEVCFYLGAVAARTYV
jgi:adenosylcobinamide-GDP ribazoletransferase